MFRRSWHKTQQHMAEKYPSSDGCLSSFYTVSQRLPHTHASRVPMETPPCLTNLQMSIILPFSRKRLLSAQEYRQYLLYLFSWNFLCCLPSSFAQGWRLFDYQRRAAPPTGMGKGFAGVLRIGQTCAKATKNHAWTPFQFGCLSSPTPKARGSNPPGRTKKGRCIAVQRLFLFVTA